MSNILHNIGDVLLVRIEPQLRGYVTLSGYTDNLTGITSTRNVTREFQLSTDNGIFWTQFKELNPANLSAETLVVDDSLIIIVKYTRIGTDDTGDIEFNDINFTGSWQTNEFVAPTLMNSIFSSVVNTPQYVHLFRNLFKKLYFRGILPEYITRGANRDKKEDEDFISLTSTIARFFSLLIRFFKRFENFRNDEELLREQIRQYGIYFNEKTITLEELQYLASHIFNQTNQRGTNLIFYRKGELLPNGENAPIDGEFIRLLQQEVLNELLYEEIDIDKIGWCLSKSSPMYRGTSFSIHLNKAPEDTVSFGDISKYTTSYTGNGVVAIISASPYADENCLLLQPNNDESALGRINDTFPITANLCNVDYQIDYEITFMFCVINNQAPDTYYLTTPKPDNILTPAGDHLIWQSGGGGAISPADIKFGVEGFDKHGNLIANPFINLSGNTLTNDFFTVNTSKFKEGTWYFVRGILHAYSTHPLQGTKTNIGFGEDLIFNSTSVAQILPYIVCSNGDVNFLILDYKIRPLVRGKNILPLNNGNVDARSLGFIQSNRWMHVYARNNNISQSQEDVTNIIEKYLMPYKTTNIYTFSENN